MGLGNTLVLAQVTAFLLLFLLGFFIFIPYAVNLTEFNGNCLLYADGTWVTNATLDRDQLSDLSWGDTGLCKFVTFMGIISIPLSLFYIGLYSIYLFKGSDPSWLAAFISVLVSALMTLFILVCAIVTTDGFKKWCNLIDEKMSCETAEFIPVLEAEDISTSGFYIEFGMAQFGLWTSWICWIALLAMSSYKMYLYHSQEHFFTSMIRERERLIQRVAHEDQVVYT